VARWFVPDAGKLTLEVRARAELGDFVLDVEHRFALSGVTGLFGPSGSGKSTLLRFIAGLEKDAEGMVRFGGETWMDSAEGTFLAAHRRPVGLVFQDARLFSHLSVAENLQYALRRRRNPQVEADYDEIVGIMNIAGLLGRGVQALSGGERQRVAVARTLLSRPGLLLLDEPMASLDAGHKREVLPYLEALPQRFGIPIILVSHSVSEMARLADEVVMLEDGRVVADGPAQRILSRESVDPAAWSFEAVSILEVQVSEQLHRLHLTEVRHQGQPLLVPAIEGVAPGDTVRLAVRAGDVVVATAEPTELSVRNVLRGSVTAVSEIPGGPFVTLTMDVDGTPLCATLTLHAVRELGIETGRPVYALLKTATFDRGL
jgi:molybdate transport system ATP-binding protein